MAMWLMGAVYLGGVISGVVLLAAAVVVRAVLWFRRHRGPLL